MKKFFTSVMMILALNAEANIDNAADARGERPSSTKISSNRECFSTLERLGCGDPGDDVEHFKSCLSNVFSDLPKNCQNLMNDLYQSK